MAASFEVWLCTPTGRRLALLTDYVAMSYVTIDSDVGQFEIVLPLGAIEPSAIGVDYQVHIWRRPDAAAALALVFVGFVRRWYFDQDEERILIAGPDLMDLLNRRVIAAAAGSANADKSATAGDDIIKAYVTENLVPPLIAARKFATFAVTVAADASAGTSTTTNAAYKPLLETLRDIKAESAALGNEIFFGFVVLSVDAEAGISIEFQTKTGQWGQDLTVTGGRPVVFSPQWGNLSAGRLEYDHTGEANYIYSLGQGAGADRTIAEKTDTVAVAASAGNRRERAAPAFAAKTAAAVGQVGNAALYRQRSRALIYGEIVDAADTPYQSVWNMGDYVTVELFGQRFDRVIRAVQISVDSSGRESVAGHFERGATARNKTERAIMKLAAGQREINNSLLDMAASENSKYRGTGAGTFTTTILPNHGDHGFDTKSNEIAYNANGSVRYVTTSP